MVVMGFKGINIVDISQLKLSQIYLSQKKIAEIITWFIPSLENFQPVCVRDFLSNGNLHITDGHTRTYIAWLNGVKQIPVIYDNCEIVSCELGQIQYRNDIEWCDRFNLQSIADLSDRVLTEADYEELWRGRCGKMYDLEVALLEGKIDKKQFSAKNESLKKQNLYIYGISEDHTVLYYENEQGELFEIPYTAV